MILRNIVLAAALLLMGSAAVVVLRDPAAWPMLLVSVLLVGGIIFERQRYGAAGHAPTGAGWAATAERFIDEEGVPVRVWFNAESGERRYVRDDNARR